MSNQESQDQHSQLTQYELLQKYYYKWCSWMNQLKKQRFQAIKVYNFQSQLQQKRLKLYFLSWRKMAQQLRYQENNQRQQQQINRIQQIQQNNERQQDHSTNNQIQKLCFVINYHQKKLYTKSFRALMHYGIQSRKFQHKLSLVYAKYILKKYFEVMNSYRINSKQKKSRKAQTLAERSRQISQKQPASNAHSQINFNSSNSNNSMYNTNKNYNRFFEAPKLQDNQQINNTMIQFSKNRKLAQSRRSQFSTTSVQFQYQSKRKFRPITQIPSLPNVDPVTSLPQQISTHVEQKRFQRTPIKNYQESRIKQLIREEQLEQNLNKIQDNRNTNIEIQNRLKNNILELITKQKLITLAIINTQEFAKQSGLQYQNYREKTLATLRKIKEIKIN